MAVEVASLKAVLDLDKKGFDAGLKQSSTELGGFGKAAQSAFAIVGTIGLATAALSGVTATLSSMANAARESAQVNKQLEQVIKSTGGVAGVTADAARDLAEALSLVTNYDDDAVIGAQNLLLTFTKIGSSVFPQATETVLDMSEALGQDLKSSAMQVGKALNDPINGIGALSRVGVTFSAQQKQQVKDFMAVNDIASAQGVILGELAKEFGGQARALADPMTQLSNAFGEIQESLGAALLPPLTALAQAILPAIREAANALAPVMASMGTQWAAVLGPAVAEFGKLFVEVINGFTAANAGLQQLNASLGLGEQGINLFKLAILPLVPLAVVVGGALKILGVTFQVLGAVFQSVGFIVTQVRAGWANMNAVGDRMNQIGIMLQATWTRFTAALSGLWGWILKVKAAWDSLVASLGQSVGLDPNLTPGSPTPLENGLRGINQQLKQIRPLTSKAFGGIGGMTPTGGGVSGGSKTINVNIGNVSATSVTNGNPADETVRMVLQLLRQQLSAA